MFTAVVLAGLLTRHSCNIHSFQQPLRCWRLSLRELVTVVWAGFSSQVNSSNIDHIHPNAFLTELNVHAIKLQINRYPPLVAEEPAALFALHDMQRLHVVNLQTWISMRGSRHSLELISRLTESELKATLHTIADVCSGGHGHVSEFMKNANPSQRALFNCLNISGRKV